MDDDMTGVAVGQQPHCVGCGITVLGCAVEYAIAQRVLCYGCSTSGTWQVTEHQTRQRREQEAA